MEMTSDIQNQKISKSQSTFFYSNQKVGNTYVGHFMPKVNTSNQFSFLSFFCKINQKMLLLIRKLLLVLFRGMSLFVLGQNLDRNLGS